ncbi:hypothetical protein BCR34DRAFT_279088 [Clohesyomyces aquaticus]|uniref:F-box domain-containing protein n=1 Tax=Clohesyomyces aquaticus TaxID=1231657 RepID=A0A1Y1ZS39_9PLEO|nr:hypothetical protein BCR34DRAFT_279088 [Clohesyomyces aquaticus]
MLPALLALPLELRELIYQHIFSTYTIRHGYGRPTSSNRVALLQTCKQIHHEAWRFLPLSAQFDFRGTEAMLDTLLSVDQSVVTRVRHMRVRAYPFPLYAEGRVDYYSTYEFSNALSLLPGLHLNRLVVDDCWHGFGMVDGWRDVVTYFDIEALIKSDGWKELVYHTPNTDFIASGYDHRKKRVAQPENWNALLKERDGEAEVQMFLTPDKKRSDVTHQPNKPRPWKAQPGHEVILNPKIAEPDQDLKGAVTIVARRGKRARYVVLGLSEKRTWKELKGKAGGFSREDWEPYYNDTADAVGWIYGGWGRRMQMASRALSS